MTIRGTNYDLKVTMSVIWRYASWKRIKIDKVTELLDNMTMDDLLGIISFADKTGDLTIDYLYELLDESPDIITDFANLLNESMGEQKPEKSGTRKAAKR